MESTNAVSSKRNVWRNILMVLLKTITYIVVVALGMVAGMGVITTVFPDTNLATMAQSDLFDWKMLNYQYIGLALGVVSSTLLYRYFVDDKKFQSLGLSFNKIGKEGIMGIVWAVGILALSFLIVWGLNGVDIIQTEAIGIGLLGYLSFFFLVAIVEEFVFRGYLLQMMTEHLNYKVAILVTSLGFAIIHLANDHFTWIAFCNLTLGGILMALLYFKYKSLYAPIGFHWLWNYFQGNILGFGVSGNDVMGVLQISIQEPNWLSGGRFGLEGSIFTCLLLGAAIFYLWSTSQQDLEAIAWKEELEPAIA